jgi:hypothetical protein
MPRKPLELPLAVARAFVRDMRAFHAEKSPASYFDDSVNAAHRIFVKAMKLVTTADGAKWVNDENWNHGKGLVSLEPFDFGELNAEKLYRLGTPTIGHVDFYGTSFGKERRGL